MPLICRAISSVALAVWLARLFTSEATTAKPFPRLAGARGLDRGVEGPAGLVWLAMSLMICVTSPTFCAAVTRSLTICSDFRASLTAMPTTPGRFRDLSRDLVDRCRQLLRRR